MSKRKNNIRKACDDISALGVLLMIKTGKVNYPAIGEILIKTAHRIKRTTWRGNENKLDKRITDDIKQIAMRSFKNDLSNIDVNNFHPPATDY